MHYFRTLIGSAAALAFLSLGTLEASESASESKPFFYNSGKQIRYVSSQVFPCSKEQLFGVLANVPHYENMITGVKSSTIKPQQNSQNFLATFVLGWSILCTNPYTFQVLPVSPEKILAFAVPQSLEGNHVTRLCASIFLRDQPNTSETKAEFVLEVDLDKPMPNAGYYLNKIIPYAISGFQKRVQELYHK